MHCIDLNNYILKILATYFSYNEKLRKKKFPKTVADIERELKILEMRNLTLEWKNVIFKTIATSKIAFQSFITTVPKRILNELEKMQKAFLCINSTPTICNLKTLCNYYKA